MIAPKKILLSGSVFIITACGGGGSDSSSTTPEQVAANVSMAAMQTSTQALADGSLSTALPGMIVGQGNGGVSSFSISENSYSKVQGNVEALLRKTLVDFTSPDYTGDGNVIVNGPCGGQAMINSTFTTPDNPALPYPFSVSLNVNFQQFCIGDDDYDYDYDYDEDYDYDNDDYDDRIILDGLVAYDSNFNMVTDGNVTLSFTLTYADYDDDDIYNKAIQLSKSCVTDQNGSSCNNVFTSNIAGGNYTLSDVAIAGNIGVGYSLVGTLTDGNGVAYVLQATGLNLCKNGNVATGNFQLTDNTGNITDVDISSCDNYVMTYQDVAGTYSQSSDS